MAPFFRMGFYREGGLVSARCDFLVTLLDLAPSLQGAHKSRVFLGLPGWFYRMKYGTFSVWGFYREGALGGARWNFFFVTLLALAPSLWGSLTSRVLGVTWVVFIL